MAQPVLCARVGQGSRCSLLGPLGSVPGSLSISILPPPPESSPGRWCAPCSTATCGPFRPPVSRATCRSPSECWTFAHSRADRDTPVLVLCSCCGRMLSLRFSLLLLLSCLPVVLSVCATCAGNACDGTGTCPWTGTVGIVRVRLLQGNVFRNETTRTRHMRAIDTPPSILYGAHAREGGTNN